MTPADLRDCITIDFETLPIEKRPHYPPPPVGVAVKRGRKSKYYAWGHPDGSQPNAWLDARADLGQAYESGAPLLFHNGLKFDVEVGEVHMGLPRLPWQRYHDTLPALFLKDPRAATFQLKANAEDLLDAPPTERDEVIDWLIEHQPIPGKNLTATRSSKGNNAYAGAYVAYAPGKMVGRYGCGDTDRTKGIARPVFKYLRDHDMIRPYDTERQLAPVFSTMEKQGLRVDTNALGRDLESYSATLLKVDRWLTKRLKAGASLNLDSGPQLAKAIVACGIAKEKDFGKTPTGLMKTSREALGLAVKDQALLGMLKYRSQLVAALQNFIRPWHDTATTTGGLLYTEWNSTRRDHSAGKVVGARTGRCSSTPPFQTASKKSKPVFYDYKNREATAHLPKMPIRLPKMPLIRSYILPSEKGHVLIGRDHSQQELRILANFEMGPMEKAYQENPWLDLHQFAADLINGSPDYPTDKMRKKARGDSKATGLGIIYGMGAKGLAEQRGVDLDTARAIKAAYLRAFPGIGEIYSETRRRAREGEPIRTWGGREYYCEEPKLIKGEWRTFDYKLPNILIQGSAADITKAAMLIYAEEKSKGHHLLISLHDELLASVPRREARKGMKQMRVAMERPKISVPLLSEGYFCPRNFAEKIIYDEEGVLIHTGRI